MRYRQLLALAVVLGLFVFDVLLTRIKAPSNGDILGGLLPWSDARGHFYGGIYLLHGGIANEWTSRRVLSAAYNSIRALASGESLQAVLILQALLTGAACFLAARATARSHGLIAGLVTLILTSSFALPYLPMTMTETVGLTFGAVAFALIWQGIREHRLISCSIGLATLSIGLSIRPGPFLLLPAAGLAIWLALGPTIGRWRSAIGVAVAIGVAIAANVAMTRLIGNPDGAPQANIAHALYGLTAGGDWTLAYSDIPSSAGMHEHEFVQTLYQRIWANLRERPEVFFGTLWRGAAIYWRKGLLFGFCWSGAAIPTVILFGAACVVIFKRRDRSVLLLSVLAGIAMMTAGPIAVFNGENRVFAVGIPFAASLAAMFAQAFWAAVRPGDRWNAFGSTLCGTLRPPGQPRFIPELAFAGLLIAAVTILPAGHSLLAAPVAFVEPSPCPDDQMPLVFDVGIGSPVLHIVERPGAWFAPTVSAALFEAGLHRHPMEIIDALTGLKPGTALIEPFPLNQLRTRNAEYLVIADDALIPPAGTRVQLCGNVETLKSFLIYRPVSAAVMARP